MVSLGALRVTVAGPVIEATALLSHLQTFTPTDSSPGPYPLQASGPQRVEPETPRPALASTSVAASSSSARVEPEPPHTPVRGSLRLSAAPTASPAPSSTSSGPAVQDHLLASAHASLSRSSVEAAFPPCPPAWLARASALSDTENLSARGRIERAWRAGLWAREVLRGNFPTPSASQRLALASRVYVVLGGGGARPGVYRSYRDVARAIGPLSSSQAVFHGFPSDTEAEIYCRGADQPWPAEH